MMCNSEVSSLFKYRDAVVVPLIGCMTSFLAGFVSFSVLGFMAFRTGQSVDKVVASGIIGLLSVSILSHTILSTTP